MSRSISAAFRFGKLRGPASAMTSTSQKDRAAVTRPYSDRDSQSAPALPASIPLAALTAAASGYRLGPGDRLAVFVSAVEEFKEDTLRIDRRGLQPVSGSLSQPSSRLSGLCQVPASGRAGLRTLGLSNA